MTTDKAPTKIVERIRKLLASAADGANENEAANAAGLAARLMREWNLEQAEIEATGGKSEEEPIVEEVIHGDIAENAKGERVSRTIWKSVLQWGINHLFGVQTWQMRDGRVMAFGRLSDVQTVGYTYRYLVNEIEEGAERYWRLLEYQPAIGKRSTCNDWRRGAASRLQERMKAMRAEQDNAELASKGALVVVKRKAEEVEKAFGSYCKDHGLLLVGNTNVRGSRGSSAAAAGEEAGEQMRITGGAAIGAEARRLGSAT